MIPLSTSSSFKPIVCDPSPTTKTILHGSFLATENNPRDSKIRISVASTIPRFVIHPVSDPFVANLQPLSMHSKQPVQFYGILSQLPKKPMCITTNTIKADDQTNKNIEKQVSTAEDLNQKVEKVHNLCSVLDIAQQPKISKKEIATKDPFFAPTPPHSKLDEYDQDTKDERSTADCAITPHVTDNALSFVKKEGRPMFLFALACCLKLRHFYI